MKHCGLFSPGKTWHKGVFVKVFLLRCFVTFLVCGGWLCGVC